MSSTEIELVPCIVIGESTAAFHLQDKEDSERSTWFPKSQISFKLRNVRTGVAIAEIPLWLLNSKGWNN